MFMQLVIEFFFNVMYLNWVKLIMGGYMFFGCVVEEFGCGQFLIILVMIMFSRRDK